MTYRLPDDLPARYRAAGLEVVEIPGWRTRGRPGSFAPVGSLNHHDARKDVVGDPADDLTWAKWMFLTGRGPSLPAPLCQQALSMEGVVYIGASGRANHAGVAKPSGSVSGGDGNMLYVGTEWMLSGSQPIPKKMYDAAVKMNGVLMDVLGNSEQTISCHYNTSITGKWDIGDPNGIEYKGHKVLNVPKFRQDVKIWRASRVPAKPERDFTVVKLMHASLQFSDSPKQQKADIKDILERAKERGVWGITGTEAGAGADPTGRLLVEFGQKAGFKVYVPSERRGPNSSPTDNWIMVDESRVMKGSWGVGFRPAIPDSDHLYAEIGSSARLPRWGEKGVAYAAFVNKEVGPVAIGTAHYLTQGRNPKNQPINGLDHYELNRDLAEEIGDWAREYGKGQGIVFYGGDQNMNDRKDDTFFGQPLTTAWDELNKYEQTHPTGPIDVIASYDGDGRVEAIRVRALDDKEFFQHHDHFVVEADYRVLRVR